jgi:hypothetical protein
MLRVRISGGWEHRDHATGRPIRWAIRQGHKGFADTLNDSAATCEHSKSIAIEVGFCNVFNTCARLSPSTPLKSVTFFVNRLANLTCVRLFLTALPQSLDEFF